MKKLAVPEGLMGEQIHAYTPEAAARKRRFLRDAQTFLNALARQIGLKRVDYDLRANPAGVAVSGEVTLHGDTLYVQVFESCCLPRGVSVLYRRCHGRHDYCGETNHFAKARTLADADALDRFVAELHLLGGLGAETHRGNEQYAA